MDFLPAGYKFGNSTLGEDKMTVKTIKDIAKKAGVSVATVSKVINNYSDIGAETRQRVLKILEEESFEPNVIAKSLSGKQSYSIGLFVAHNPTPGLHHAFFQGVVFGLQRTLGKHGYDFVLLSDSTLKGSGDFLQKCRTRQVDGAVFMGIDKNEPSLASLLNSKLPSVFIDGDHCGRNSRCVVWDNYSGARQAVEYFYNLGHRKIALIQGLPGVKPTEERTEGFLEALRKYNLTCPTQWIVGNDYLEVCGYEGMKKLIKQSDRPTAVFCQSDSIAVGALMAIEESGLKCPDDISIIGYDDIDLCKYIKPRLTTIRQDTDLMGRNAAKVLLGLIRQTETTLSPVVLSVELIERDSCCRI